MPFCEAPPAQTLDRAIMGNVGALALLTLVAALSCLSLVDLRARQATLTAWRRVTATVGVTAFLSAVGLVLQRNGIVAGSLLLLLSSLVYDTAERLRLARRSITLCAWLGLAALFVFIGIVLR